MALATYNATLEYATNTLEFWLYDDAGGDVAFDTSTTLTITRIDNDTNTYSVVGKLDGNKVTFIVTPPISLASSTDNLYSYDEPEFYHIYSIKSNNQVYLSGKLNLVKAA